MGESYRQSTVNDQLSVILGICINLWLKKEFRIQESEFGMTIP